MLQSFNPDSKMQPVTIFSYKTGQHLIYPKDEHILHHRSITEGPANAYREETGLYSP